MSGEGNSRMGCGMRFRECMRVAGSGDVEAKSNSLVWPAFALCAHWEPDQEECYVLRYRLHELQPLDCYSETSRTTCAALTTSPPVPVTARPNFSAGEFLHCLKPSISLQNQCFAAKLSAGERSDARSRDAGILTIARRLKRVASST